MRLSSSNCSLSGPWMGPGSRTELCTWCISLTRSGLAGIAARRWFEEELFWVGWVSGPPESEPGTSISPHGSLVAFADGGGTLRVWDTVEPKTSVGRDVALCRVLVVTEETSELEERSGRLWVRF